MDKQFKQLKELWLRVPNWARDMILKLAIISTKGGIKGVRRIKEVLSFVSGQGAAG